MHTLGLYKQIKWARYITRVHVHERQEKREGSGQKVPNHQYYEQGYLWGGVGPWDQEGLEGLKEPCALS